jgi:Raf kinase inhibitor-like YbhB/YbcL family protein
MTRGGPADPGLPRAVEACATRALAESAVPGLAVALVCHGRVAWAAGYGMADRATGEPVTEATCFQAASVSKPVTAWGALRLVGRGRIGLDEPVVGHLRHWRPPPSPFDADGITLRRLLSHTAGLSVHGYAGQTPDRPLPSITASLLGEAGGSFPVELLDAPGRRWLYSGGGYSVVQLLVEELTGRSFAEFMQAQVLGPLGMTASSFRWRRTAATARPHDAVGGRVPDLAFAEQAAAGLVTTAPDLARFVAAALPGPHGEPPGRGVLSPAGVRLALTAAPATDGRWGLGYGLGLLPGGDLLAYHEGANRGWRAGLALLPERRAGIVVLANSDGGSAPIDAVVQHWVAHEGRLAVAELSLSSSAFADGEPIPRRHTCDGEGQSPPLSWSAPPAATRSLALILDDPDAPSGRFVHWLAWGIAPDAGGLAGGQAAPSEGRNGFGTVGYRGPCPPRGHGPHRYRFWLYAVAEDLRLAPGADVQELERALTAKVVAVAELVGTYQR